jgi:hypothetical protein
MYISTISYNSVGSSSINGLSAIPRILFDHFARGYSIPQISETVDFVHGVLELRLLIQLAKPTS